MSLSVNNIPSDAVVLSLVFASPSALKTYAAIISTLLSKNTELQGHERRVLQHILDNMTECIQKMDSEKPKGDVGHDSVKIGVGGSIVTG